MNKTVDVMIDLETLGVQVNSVILQIGIALFTPDEILESHLIRVDVQSSLDYGMEIDAGTLRWWSEQPNFRDVIAPRSAIPLPSALINLHTMGKFGSDNRVWCYGPHFDIAILHHAYDVTKIAVPWKYKQVHDVRTLRFIVEKFVGIPIKKEENDHNAEQDAINQARYVQSCMKVLGTRLLSII